MSTSSESTAKILALESPAFAALAREILARGDSLRYRATGGSMRPCICTGDVLTVAPADIATCRRGEVLLYAQPGGAVFAHRVVARRRVDGGWHYALRGDASCGPVEWIAASAVLGRVVSRTRGGVVTRLEGVWARLAGRLRAMQQSLRAWHRG